MASSKILDAILSNIRGKKTINILFVCLGNICRSPTAQGVFEKLVEEKGVSHRFNVDSCGFYGGHAGDLPDRRMRAHAIRRGYNLTHISRKIKPWDFDDFDIIIGMDENNCNDLMAAARSESDRKKIVRMMAFSRNHPYYDYVPDPYYSGAEGFEIVLDLLEDACQGLLDAILGQSDNG